MTRVFRYLILPVLCAALLAASACGTAKEIDVHSVGKKITEAVTLPEMKEVGENSDNAKKGFAAISDLDYDKVEAFDLYYAADGSSYEIAVIALKSESDIAALESSLQRHLTQRQATFRTYKPEQVMRAEKAVVATRGRYATLLMCDDISGAKAVFDAAFDD